MGEDVYGRLARSLREARTEAGLTQEQLAEKVGKSLSFIGYIERGQRKPSLDTVQKLAEALRVPMGELLGDTPPRKDAAYAATQRLTHLIGRVSESDRKAILAMAKALAQKMSRRKKPR